MLRIWVDAHDRPLEPTFASPELGIKEHFDAVPYVDGFGHFICA